MAPPLPQENYDILIAEYTTLTTSHSKILFTAKGARNQFIDADRVELDFIRRSITCYSRLLAHSAAYRTHHRFVQTLCRRVLSWSQDVRAREKAQELDEIEMLRYGTCWYQLMSAGSELVAMNKWGAATRKKSDALYQRVQKAKKRKADCDRVGREAYEKQNDWTDQALKFLGKLEVLAVEGQKSGWGPEREEMMELWMDNVELRIKQGANLQGSWQVDVKGEHAECCECCGESWDGNILAPCGRVNREEAIRQLDVLLEKTKGEGCSCCFGTNW